MIPLYKDWLAVQAKNPKAFTSYDAYLADRDLREYECVLLDPRYKLWHDEEDSSVVLFATDNLGEACGFVYNYCKEHNVSVGVWQQRTQGYREHYHQTDDEGGVTN